MGDASQRSHKKLEELTGETFEVDSVKTQLGMPTPEKLQDEQAKIDNGYYSPEKVEERQNEAKSAFIKEMRDRAEKDIAKIRHELSIKERLFEVGGKRLLDNVIYYNHTNTIKFNWHGYGERIEREEADKIMSALALDVAYEVA